MRSTPGVEAAPTRGLRSVSARVYATASRVAASRWALPLGRMALFSAGLILLALIGDSALAKSPKGLAAVGALPTVEPELAAALSSSSSDGGANDQEHASQARGSAHTGSDPQTLRASSSTNSTQRATPDDPVILNSASLEDFQRLPGVGPKRARAIFDLRARIGRFRHVEDLLRVKGIGRNTLKKLRPLVRLDPPEPRVDVTGDAGGTPRAP
jgi:competence protein ComEA